ncbi:uncharacterized protein BDV14DRAFT_21046 [Aspergillus stella-maris]|uniref:uncharacterized protein n=1 Tax=Aspergillus stella-maris TaxID=1810926 RepID=UPI003CCCC910
MVNLQTVRAHNESLKSLGPGLVAVFVGGTSGISLSTALALARHSTSPRIYLIGRSQSAADDAIQRIKTLNPNAQPTFLKADISLLKGVDSICEEIKKREKYLNLLFMTPGYLTLSGRDETSEGMDRKLVLHYYARMRFVRNLQPLLSKTASQDSDLKAPSLSRVVSVLDPWTPAINGGQLNYSDLSLKHNFSLRTCGLHASMMGNFYLETMARRYPKTSFIHAFPSGVDTGVARDFPGAKIIMPIARVLLRPWMVPIEESGERHLFAATSGRYPALNVGKKKEEDVAVGSNGDKGSGCYWLSWDGEPFSSHSKFEKVRGEEGGERIVKHTEEVFGRVCGEGKTYP